MRRSRRYGRRREFRIHLDFGGGNDTESYISIIPNSLDVDPFVANHEHFPLAIALSNISATSAIHAPLMIGVVQDSDRSAMADDGGLYAAMRVVCLGVTES